LLVFIHLPLPWYEGAPLVMPFIYVAGMWMAVLSSIAFTAMYAFRVAAEARLLANALAATELVLQREQHLSALDGLAAAAAHELGTPLATITLVAKEMEKALGSDPKYGEDVKLLRSQSERCREILKRLTSLSSEGEAHLSRLPLTSLVEEVTAPHRDFGISIKLRPGERSGPEPVGRRNPGVIYGLGNLVENAIDFAASKVDVEARWTKDQVSIVIADDGDGFPPYVLEQLGEPYVTTRPAHTDRQDHADEHIGMGLGFFIAKTLLERSGATLDFRNSSGLGEGAVVQISWPRSVFLNPETAPATMFDTA
jgi:two-component system sensor histidine kinase RegB